MRDPKTKTPSDLVQVPIVWRYEFLRYLRSWRLVASILLVVVVLALIFLLPPALGHPYSGTDTNRRLGVEAIPSSFGIPIGSAAALPRAESTISHLTISVNNVTYPSSNWSLVLLTSIPSFPQIPGLSGTYALLFKNNLTGDYVTATYDWKITAERFESLNLQFANFLIVICATFFGADSIAGEFWNRTGYLLFPNPVKRGTMFFGKFAASMTAGAIVVSALYVGVLGLSYPTAGGIDNKIGLSYLFALEYLMAAMAIGYFVSSVLKGTTGAIILTFFALVLILPIIDGVASFTSTNIPESLTFSAGVITFILQTPYPTGSQSFGGGPGFSITTFYPDPATSAVVMFGWVVVAVVVSLILFRRKQLLA